ncbi:MAG: sarcosine oxidase subunit gamma family protein, partial [Candidatus Nanopelagicales bacterium]
TCIEVSGFWAKSVLEHAWEQDLDEVTFPVGSCSQGLMARCPTIIHKTAANNYRLYVRSSFAEHLYKFLVDASTEYLN